MERIAPDCRRGEAGLRVGGVGVPARSTPPGGGARGLALGGRVGPGGGLSGAAVVRAGGAQSVGGGQCGQRSGAGMRAEHLRRVE